MCYVTSQTLLAFCGALQSSSGSMWAGVATRGCFQALCGVTGLSLPLALEQNPLGMPEGSPAL